MFDWFNSLGITETVLLTRKSSINFIQLPDWFYYSLPDGLWTYSFTSSILLIWGRDNGIQKYWIYVPLVLSVLPELSQYFKIIPGTFDWIDLIFIVLAFLTSFTILNPKKNESVF